MEIIKLVEKISLLENFSPKHKSSLEWSALKYIQLLGKNTLVKVKQKERNIQLDHFYSLGKLDYQSYFKCRYLLDTLFSLAIKHKLIGKYNQPTFKIISAEEKIIFHQFEFIASKELFTVKKLEIFKSYLKKYIFVLSHINGYLNNFHSITYDQREKIFNIAINQNILKYTSSNIEMFKTILNGYYKLLYKYGYVKNNKTFVQYIKRTKNRKKRYSSKKKMVLTKLLIILKQIEQENHKKINELLNQPSLSIIYDLLKSGTKTMEIRKAIFKT